MFYCKLVYSSHNWNTLFLGANAVADVVADKYGASKSQLLDPVSNAVIWLLPSQLYVV